MQSIFRKLTLVVLVAILVIAALPLSTSYAAGLNDTATPPAPAKKIDPAISNARVELLFSRQQMKVLIIGQAVMNFDLMSADVQKLLDKAKKKGLDVAALQAAFDAYKSAFTKGTPIYKQAQEIVSNRPGFDASGKVTNIELARATVKSLADVIKQYHDTVGDSFKALREAIKAFREANPRPTRTPTPTSG